MNDPLLRLLDRADDLPEWLEEQLVGPDLLGLVEILQLVRPNSSTQWELPSGWLDQIIRKGLVSLEESAFESLMQHPQSLLTIQEAVLTQGGAYWQTVIQRTRPVIRTADVVPWYRQRGAWIAVTVSSLAAALLVGVCFLALKSGDPLRQELAQEKEQTEALRRELAALQRDHPPLTPSDCPESDFATTAASDPGDLPDGDPQDLPERNRARSF